MYTQDAQIALELNLKAGQWIASKDAKERLKEAFKRVGKQGTAKATCLADYYIIENDNRWVDGKKVAGFLVKMVKYSFAR